MSDTSTMRSPVSANLRAAQAAAGITNEALARQAGVGVRLLQKWRAGTVEPRYEGVAKIAAVLERDVQWFYTEPETEASV